MSALARLRTAFVVALHETPPVELLSCLDDCRARVSLLVARRASEMPPAPETVRSCDCTVLEASD